VDSVRPRWTPTRWHRRSGSRRTPSTYGCTASIRGLLNAVGAGAKPAQPTEADLRDVYDRLTAGGGNPNGASFEQFSTGISAQDRQTLAQNIGLRNDLQPQIAKLNTVVNPKYSAPELPLVSTQGANGQELPLVVLPFAPSQGAPPVVDVP
jgi:hypothetical protein